MQACSSLVRRVIHADLDAFYASVEQMDNPELVGKPVLVGGSPERRGVVAACSYEARAFGVHSAMPMRTAVNRCPHGVVVPPRFDRYHQVSQRVMAIFRSMTPEVEPLSLDEAYLDVTETIPSEIPDLQVARNLKDRVINEVGLTLSVGSATSKSVAKIASDLGKPDGLVVVEPGTEKEFLAPLPIRKLGGIGPKTESRLLRAGVETLGDLAARSDEWLKRQFGKRGLDLGALCRGNDERPVAPRRRAKSVSAEVTFPQDIGDSRLLLEEVARLCVRVGERLEQQTSGARTVTVKLRLADFTTLTRSTTLPMALRDAHELQRVSQRILQKELFPGRKFRLLGVGVSGFVPPGQLPLFDVESTTRSL